MPEGVTRYAAIVSYNGSAYSGFQRQKDQVTVQGELETGLSSIANTPIVIAASGRTDSGVHASHQVIHFDSKSIRSSANWIKGTNSRLPSDISLSWARDVEPQFHARFSAESRTYRYVIGRSVSRPALLADFMTWTQYPLDTRKMSEACSYLLGEQDFSTFRGATCQSRSPCREVTRAVIYDYDDWVIFEISANAFVLHMVRNIVGSLLEVGYGRQPPHWVAALLQGRDRTKAAATAPARGLYLVAVDYPAGYSLPIAEKGPLFLPRDMGVPVSPT